MKPYIFIYLFFFSVAFFSCKKDWLDAKPKQSLTIPSTVKDLQALLDNNRIFNADVSALSELGNDDYYLSDATYTSRSALERKVYTWMAGNIFEGETGLEPRVWSNYYRSIFYANNVLERLEKINGDEVDLQTIQQLRGTALFYRAVAFYELAQLFCKTYSPADSKTELGIPLRLGSDINVPSVRSNIEETYQQIISDCKASATYLPLTTNYKTRPNRAAAFGLLARTFLVMQQYDEAKRFADSCLNISPTLLDYNTLSASNVTPMPGYTTNPEILFHSRMYHTSMLAKFSSGNGNVDSSLYSLYTTNDLRQQLFYETVSGRRVFAGNYDGGSSLFLFNGIATDEIYLIRAECYARAGNSNAALADLNALLIKRWKSGTFVPVTATSASDALDKVLRERRLELCFRGLRWTDLRRLNLETKYATILTRKLGMMIYTLPPNDSRYVYPIPDDEMLYNPLPQNMR